MRVSDRSVLVLLVYTWLVPSLHGKRIKKKTDDTDHFASVPLGPPLLHEVAEEDRRSPPPLLEDRIKSKRRHTTNTDTTHHRHRPAKGPLPPPEATWRAFVQHTEEEERKRRKRKRRKRKRILPLPVNRGPPGPAGPPGPPGAIVTTDKLVEELRRMIQEAAGDHLSELLRAANANTTGSSSGRLAALPSLLQLDQVPLVSRVNIAFHVRLADKVAVHRKSFLELSKFQLPFGEGSLQRGEGMDLETGRFTAPESGLYQLSAQVFVRHRAPLKSSQAARRRPRAAQSRHRLQERLLRVLICVDSQCRKHMSLQNLSSMESTPRLFTATLHGILELHQGQYVSIHVDNRSRYRLLVLGGSQFSGVMLGQ